MKNFTTILENTTVAISNNSVVSTHDYHNLSGNKLLPAVKILTTGEKDGSHFLRTSLILDANDQCQPRANSNTTSTASLLIIDCDKRVDSNGEIQEGAPNPHKVHQILCDYNIGHIIYGSYSHYVGDKGNRYRILLTTTTTYNPNNLSSTLADVISLINAGLPNELLIDAKENHTWAQPWYFPRKPHKATIEQLYLENFTGEGLDTIEPIKPPADTGNGKHSTEQISKNQISPINAFNEQTSLADLFIHYGYKRVYSTNHYEKWLSPDSTTGKPGITVWNNRFYSHHGCCFFNDGKSHDAFDLMKHHEGLTEKDAVIKAARCSLAPNGETVDKYNKSIANISKTISHATPMEHSKILEILLTKIPRVDFRQHAELEEDYDKLKKYHFYIIAIEVILETAKKHSWGICKNHDFIYLYNSAYWCLIDKDTLRQFLGNAAEKMGIDKFFARDFNFREQLYKQFIAIAHLPKPEQPKDVVLVNLENGTFEISPSETRLKSFEADDFMTYQLPFAYNPDTGAPQFQQYLNKVLPDKTLQLILAEYLGYVFIRPSTLKLEKTLLLYGSGANGKSVFYEIVKALFGKHNTSEYSLQSLTNENGYYRAMIANTLVNYASEINGKLEASIFKQLVSGEPVEARLPHGAPFIMSDYAKLIFNCNELPREVEQTNAFFRRFLIVPFNVTIPECEQDKQLASKIIKTELSGIFNWVLDGLKRLLTQKDFTQSKIVEDMRRKYEKESDSTKLFTEEFGYTPCDSSPIAIKDLYNEYRTFCQESGHHSVSSQTLKKRLESSGIKTARRNIGNVAFLTKCQTYTETKYGE